MATVKTILKFSLWLAVSMMVTAEGSFAQDSVVPSQDVDLAQKPLEDVRIEEETIGQLLSRFSYAYNVPVGLEIARNVDKSAAYRLHLKKGTLADLLTQFVKEHKEYAWKTDNGVVSVFPKEDYRDPVIRELLETRISSFSVTKNTDIWTFGKNLLSTPETKNFLQLYGLTYDTGYLTGFYIQQLGNQYSFDVSNMQFKSILDKVIKESPVARYWVISNETSAKKLFLRVHAELEYSAKPSKP